MTLASLQAPRFSRGPQTSSSSTTNPTSSNTTTNDDKYAWESREYLRKLCIGKTVTFNIIFCVASVNKNYADIYLISAACLLIALFQRILP